MLKLSCAYSQQLSRVSDEVAVVAATPSPAVSHSQVNTVPLIDGELSCWLNTVLMTDESDMKLTHISISIMVSIFRINSLFFDTDKIKQHF